MSRNHSRPREQSALKPMRSYVVRVYRRDAEVYAGLVEAVQSGRSASFQTLAELCDVLSGRKPFRRRAARLRGRSTP